MKAIMAIQFEDGTTREIDLGEKCSVIQMDDEGKAPLAITRNGKGEYRLAYTQPLMQGKQWTEIRILKSPLPPTPE